MRIGIVSDSHAMVRTLRDQIAAGARHQVAWMAMSGHEAVDMCARTTPDLVLLDLGLSELGGVETTRRIMAGSPCAILVVTDNVGANAERVFDAMGCGAVDAVDGPDALPAKIELVARLIGDVDRNQRASDRATPSARSKLIAIGASAGGPAALATILGDLPKDFPAAIAIVQHVDEQFARGLADWLGQYSTLPVRIAKDGDSVLPGTVAVAGTGDHLILTSADRFAYTPLPREHVYRPSVDVFFDSVRRKWQGEVVGVLLTGMGRDGARGLRALRDQGHHTIAQDQATSALYGMPKAAAAMKAATEILPIGRIASRLVDLATHGHRLPGLRRLG